jgi:uncharacterized membrane protein YfcA
VSLAEILALVVLGVAAGTLAGLLGVGGGAIIVPALVLVGGFAQQDAQGTSLLVIVATAAAGSYLHFRDRSVALRSVAPIAIGGIVGVVIGSSLALQAPEGLLRVAFAGFLILTGTRLALSTREARPDEGATVTGDR